MAYRKKHALTFRAMGGQFPKGHWLWRALLRASLVLIWLLLGACHSFEPKLPDITPPKISAKWIERIDETVYNTEVDIQIAWWEQFNDPLLNQWVSLALDNNKDIQVAWSRLREVQLITNATRSVRWPSLDLSLSVDRSRQAEFDDDQARRVEGPETDVDLGLRSVLSLDIFGQRRKQLTVAKAQETLVQAEARATALSTISAVVEHYFRCRGLQKRIAKTEQNTALLKESLALIETRQNVGEASEFDVSRARGEYQFSRTRLPELKGSLRATEYALAVLLGQSPGSLRAQLSTNAEMPRARPKLPLGQRADLLTRRPDFLLAQAELEAELAGFDLSVSELYPTFTLETFLGYSKNKFARLISNENQRWSADIFLDWPLFQIHTRRQLATANRERVTAALLGYEKVALQGLAEVESAIAAYDAALAGYDRLAEVVKSRLKTHRLARALYEAGEEDYFAVIDAERELVARRDDLVVAETNTVLALTALYVSLGGGWELADPSATTVHFSETTNP